MFFRAYIVDPSVSVNGDPIGGMKGYLKILQKLLRETKPDKVIICWDGPGGSQKRKQMNKAQSEGHKKIKKDIVDLQQQAAAEGCVPV